MQQLVNLPSDPWSLEMFRDADDLEAFYTGYGCHGIELILCGEEFGERLRPGMVKGLHLPFYPEWIRLWHDDFDYLDAEFGSREAWQGFYAAASAQELLALYRHELEVAQRLGAEYVVFHMGDNPLDEYYTLAPRMAAEQMVDESCDFLNALFTGVDYGFDLLLENLWLDGMNLTKPDIVARALAGIRYPRTGLMLDTGHLMITNPALRTPEEACVYIGHVVDGLGDAAAHIKGVHLHASLSGEYFRTLPLAPPPREMSYLDRFSQATVHLRQIDPHKPFVADVLPRLIGRIAPEWLVHELSRTGREDWAAKLKAQTDGLLA